jgi:hypothetical protein
MNKKIAVGLIGIVLIGAYAVTATLGSGAFKRHFTLSGIYSICKPDGYDVVCFLDADGREGGMFCTPLSQLGGNCRK